MLIILELDKRIYATSVYDGVFHGKDYYENNLSYNSNSKHKLAVIKPKDASLKYRPKETKFVLTERNLTSHFENERQKGDYFLCFLTRQHLRIQSHIIRDIQKTYPFEKKQYFFSDL